MSANTFQVPKLSSEASRHSVLTRTLVALISTTLVMSPVAPAMAQNGSVLSTPAVPMELPIEMEIELSPAGSLKQAATWKELYQLLKNPSAFSCPADDPTTLENESYFCTSTLPRRDGFGVAMPPLKIYSPGYNFLTAQPLRRRTSDGEVSWDQPGPMFDPAQNVALDAFSTPTILRIPIGHIVACPNVDNPLTNSQRVLPGSAGARDFLQRQAQREPRRLQQHGQ